MDPGELGCKHSRSKDREAEQSEFALRVVSRYLAPRDTRWEVQTPVRSLDLFIKKSLEYPRATRGRGLLASQDGSQEGATECWVGVEDL